MANTQWTYVRSFETNPTLLPNTFLVVRIDGRNFHKFTSLHNYAKPNDDRGLQLMNKAAQYVMAELSEIVLAYGQSDEFSFVFDRKSNLYKRREAKIVTAVVSLFTSAFVLYWKSFFGSDDLQYPPSFDGRGVVYPTTRNLRDYLNWRQADCHINNMYNTCFWALVQDKALPHTNTQAEKILKETDSAGKNELLFSKYNTNYNQLPPMYRKGTVLYRKRIEYLVDTERGQIKRTKSMVMEEFVDIIGEIFWKQNSHLLGTEEI